VEGDAGHAGFLLEAAGEVDAGALDDLVRQARDAGTADRPDRAAALLDQALTLWGGPAYAEFADEDFARPDAVRLDDLRLVATEDAFAARAACGDEALIADLEAFVAANPLRERPHAQLMTALARDGRQTEALDVYQRLRDRLTEDLGLEPSPSLQQLQADILRQAPGVTVTAAHADDRARAAVSPAPRLREVVGNLPAASSDLIGREAAVEKVSRLLEDSSLVTLTGVGGVGKTRLAQAAATAVARHHPDGVWWVELAPADHDAVGHAVAAVLGVQQQTDRSISASLVGAMANKRLLLVLDNCEHVVEAVAALCEQVRRRCPEVTMLATSREPLAVVDERVWLVPPLPVPTDDDPRGAASVELFTERGAATFDLARAGEFGFADPAPSGPTQGYRQVLVGPAHPYLTRGMPMDFPGVGYGQNDLFSFQARAFLEQVAGLDRLPRVTPRAYRRITLLTVASLLLITAPAGGLLRRKLRVPVVRPGSVGRTRAHRPRFREHAPPCESAASRTCVFPSRPGGDDRIRRGRRAPSPARRRS
jgi:hypothetical protein